MKLTNNQVESSLQLSSQMVTTCLQVDVFVDQNNHVAFFDDIYRRCSIINGGSVLKQVAPSG